MVFVDYWVDFIERTVTNQTTHQSLRWGTYLTREGRFAR